MKKRNLFLSGLYAFLLLSGVLFLISVFVGCTPEDDLPAYSEVVYPDDHVEWTNGVRYFPIRQVFVNCKPEDITSLSFNYGVKRPFVEIIDSLNKVFSAASIQFYLSSTKIVSGNVDVSKVPFGAYDADGTSSKAINLYLIKGDIGVSGRAGMPVDFPGSTSSSNNYSSIEISVINNNGISFSTLVHEFGHYFGLYHTFEAGEYSGIYEKELVDGSNGDTAGDLVSDTPADFFEGGSVAGLLSYDITIDKEVYIGTVRDSNGDLYAPDISNHMSYWPDNDHFTAGQYVRMRDCSFWSSLDILVKGPSASSRS